jgi:hypothetical protein
MRRTLPTVSAIAVLALAAVTCGGTGEGRIENIAKTCPAATPAMSGTPSFPRGWPAVIQGATYTSSTKAGPSTIVTGYFADDLGGAYGSYRQALKSSGYTITRSEHDPEDAEVDFSGGGSTGEVKMHWLCRGRTDLTITIRPS